MICRLLFLIASFSLKLFTLPQNAPILYGCRINKQFFSEEKLKLCFSERKISDGIYGAIESRQVYWRTNIKRSVKEDWINLHMFWRFKSYMSQAYTSIYIRLILNLAITRSQCIRNQHCICSHSLVMRWFMRIDATKSIRTSITNRLNFYKELLEFLFAVQSIQNKSECDKVIRIMNTWLFKLDSRFMAVWRNAKNFKSKVLILLRFVKTCE